MESRNHTSASEGGRRGRVQTVGDEVYQQGGFGGVKTSQKHPNLLTTGWNPFFTNPPEGGFEAATVIFSGFPKFQPNTGFEWDLDSKSGRLTNPPSSPPSKQALRSLLPRNWVASPSSFVASILVSDDMNRRALSFPTQINQFFSNKPRLPTSAPTHLVQTLSSLSSAHSRPFPDYSPKKPTIKDSEFIHQISTTVKHRRAEPLLRVLKPYESRFRPDHLIWVLMKIRGDYRLVLDFFDWVCLRRDPSMESICIVVHIAVAAKDPEKAHGLIRDFWVKKTHLGNSVLFAQFVERLVYTYKDWGCNPLVFDIFFQVLVEVGMLDEARKLFDKMLNYVVVMSVDSCNLFLSRLPKDFEGLEMGLRVFREFPEVGVCWNTASHNIVMHLICQLGKVKEAHNLLLQMEFKGCMPDVISYSTLINGYCRVEEFQALMRLVEEMQIKGLKPNKFTFDSIIFLLCKNRKVLDAETVFREMLRQGVIPDKVVYTTLVDGFCKVGKVSSAYNLLDEMQSHGIIPDFVTYTAIIFGLCQIGKMVEANELFHEMVSRGMQADEVMYTALVDGYCKSGEMKKAFLLHNQMVQIGLTPNVVTYTALADGLSKLGEVETANELLHEMCAKGLEPNIFTYNSLVNGLCKAGNIVQAVKLMEDMDVAGLQPCTITYTTLMDAYCKSGEMVKAHDLLREMLNRGLKPTIVTFNVLMNGFCMSGMLEDGERLLNWMLEKGIMPNATTYNSLMKQYCIRNDMRATSEIYRGMHAQGVVPDSNSYNILIKGHCKARNMKEAWFLHREMVEKGYRLTVASYNVLIKGFFKRKKISEARKLFEEMRREGLVADGELYSIFVDLSYSEGSMDITLELCDEAIEKCLMDKSNKENT
ncbi:hypothetical protein RHGRI_033590 [Rhododendron griersonianum]|uniref:Pentatricopeptide repeat-containing protein n=1 Tax=Rhododendron griersonianum TaxID=479676 RepID=A0AAV6HXE8_9ERIC|nr:hypothetical protein RHGRI_033590 [Rhododendron griersonianum]